VAGGFSPSAGAAYVSIGKTKLYELIKAGQIKVIKCGARTIIPRSELDDWLRRETER
jgi:excisionase family DNA binding protein